MGDYLNMDKMKMETRNLNKERLEKIADLFPECFSEEIDVNGEKSAL